MHFKKLLILFALINCSDTLSYATQNIPSHSSTKTILNRSSNVLDLSGIISQNVSIAVKNPQTGEISYTQDGYFLKKNGYFYQGNNRLQGYTLPKQLLTDSCTLADVKAADETLIGKATSSSIFGFNLSPNHSIPILPFDSNNRESYNLVMGSILHDNAGKRHTLSIYLVKSVNNSWDAHVKVDDKSIATGNVYFKTSGEFDKSSNLDNLTYTPDDSNDKQTFSIDVSHSSSNTTGDVVTFTSTDGYGAGDLIDESIDENGYLIARYNNGQMIMLSKIAVFSK